MSSAVILSAARTAIGSFMGALSPLAAPKLGEVAAIEALKRAGLKPEQIEEVIFGCVLQTSLGQNPARQVLLGAGLPSSRGALTINKVCGSGLKAVMLSAQAVKAGDAEVLLAGGMESMSNAPHYVKGIRNGLRLGNGELTDSLVQDGLWDVYNNFHMGMTAELVSEKYNVSREDQDAFAVGSHQKACAAIKEGRFKDEIVAVPVPQRKGEPLMFMTDENPREDSSLDKLAKLKPVFKKDGTVTAGNASSINDGAAAVVVASQDKAKALGIKPVAKITGYATGGLDPEWVMMAPLEAVKNWEARTGMKLGKMDLIEFNEAFSAQSVALIRELKLDADRVNVNGGAVALGHPIGCSGARILTTLIYALKHRGLKSGLAGLCLGGGNAVVMSVEMM